MALPDPEFAVAVVDWPSNAGAYGNVPVDAGDPRHRDPLVSIEEYSIAGESFYSRADGKNWPYCAPIDGSPSKVWCRRLVAEKLCRANARLADDGVELYVWDAYRPITCQRGLWDFFMAKSRREMPGASDEELRREVLKYVSDPTRFRRADSTTWPVHTSGAAIDLTIRDMKTLELCPMGARFDEMSPVSHSDHYERGSATGSTGAVATYRRNRRLLHWAMTSEGFLNYPLEFWHFDWGNQMYIHNMRLLTGKAPNAAWYGYVDGPSA